LLVAMMLFMGLLVAATVEVDCSARCTSMAMAMSNRQSLMCPSDEAT
jgi:hypothetical protein